MACELCLRYPSLSAREARAIHTTLNQALRERGQDTKDQSQMRPGRLTKAVWPYGR